MSSAEKSPEGRPHPQFILDCLAAYRRTRPDNDLPEVWDQRNGWVHFRAGGISRRFRRSQIEQMTRDLERDNAR